MLGCDLCGHTVGDFILHERIGAGRCSDLYRGEQQLLKRDVAVRVLHQWPDENARQRFMQEVQIDHPYATHIYAFGIDKTGRFWIATELVHGVTLEQWLAAHGPMPLEKFAPFFECLAQVVQAVHDHGIVHRDLKPANVMVLEEAGRLYPKLRDFGLDQPTRRDAEMGSPYMAPEQWDDDGAAGPAADIYALGVVACEVLNGRMPFIAATPDEPRQQHREAQVPPLGGDFSSDLDQILQRALARSPEARHGTALELASELCEALRTSRAAPRHSSG
jgi:serine/threonine protein kinase